MLFGDCTPMISPQRIHMIFRRLAILSVISLLVVIVLAPRTQHQIKLPESLMTRAQSSATVSGTSGVIVPAAEPLSAFADWARVYAFARTADEQRRLRSAGESLAAERLVALEKLIQAEPQKALAAALPESTRRILPAEIVAKLEVPLAGRGDVTVRAITPRPGQRIRAGLKRELHLAGQSWIAHVYGNRAKADTVYATSVSGIAVGRHAAISDDPVTILPASEVPAGAVLQPLVGLAEHDAVPSASSERQVVLVAGEYTPVCCQKHAQSFASSVRGTELTPSPFLEAAQGVANTGTAPNFTASPHTVGTKKVLVIVGDFSDKAGVPVDAATSSSMTSTYLTSAMNTQVGPFLSTVSYGKTSLGTVTVTGLLRVAGSLTTYATADNVDGIKTAALAAAKTAGFDSANYDRVIFVFADASGIDGSAWTWGGLADLGGKFVWDNGYFGRGAVSHELLHTYGLRHANLWLPADGSTNPVDPAGQSIEYGDPFDVMGEGVAAAAFADHPNPWFLARLGWLPPTAIQSVTGSGNVRLFRYDHPSASLSNALALYVDRDGTRQYWLGYRRKYLGDAVYGAAGNGATLVWGYRGNQQSDLIDVSPATTAEDAPLAVGSTFNDTAAGVSFTVSGQGGVSPNEYLDVQINFQSRVILDATAFDIDEKAGNATVLVHRRGSSTGACSVSYATQPGTATAADFTAQTSTLNWAVGDSASKSIVIPIIADSIAEKSEAFTLRLTSPVGCVLSHGNTATLTINDPGTDETGYRNEDIYGTVYDLVQQPDGKAVVVGSFPSYGSLFSPGIGRFNSDGTVDTAFEQGEGPNVTPVSCCVRQPDGKFLVGGKFTRIRGATRNFVARLNADGSLDTTFDAGVGPNVPAASDRGINCITVQPDGKVLVGGEFTTWNGVARKCLVRLLADGSLDTSLANLSTLFTVSDASNGVRSIAIQPIAAAPHFAILVGGSFYTATGNPGFHSGVVRFTAAGAKDTDFDVPYGAHASGASNSLSPVSCLVVQPDRKVLVGGQFTGFNNVTAKGIARISATGGNDSAFVSAVGSGLSGGSLVEVSRFVVQPDGGIAVAGFFTGASGASGLKGLTRYLGSGARDAAFAPSYTGSNSVGGAALTSDNRILIGMWDSTDTTRFLRRITTGISGGSAGFIRFVNATASLSEGGGTNLVVERVGGSNGAISVNFHSNSGSAASGTDFPLTTGTLSWANGDSATKSIPVSTVLDADVETTESYTVSLSNVLGGAILDTAAVGTVSITDAPANQPLIGFSQSVSDAAEGAGLQNIQIALSGPAATGPVTVNVGYSGTASSASGGDYTAPISTITITPPATTAVVPITLLDDVALEGSETVIVTLSSPTGGALSSSPVHTLTITDGEVPPSITDPVSRIAATGSNPSLSVTVSGSPTPSLQWFKGIVPLPTQTAATLTLNNVQLTDAGSYRCVATSGTFSDTSELADLVVVDATPVVLGLAVGNTATLSVATSGTGLTYQWFRTALPPVPLPTNSKYTGTTTRTLTIKTLAAADVGTYYCAVTSPAGTVNGGNNSLQIATLPPIISPPNPLPPAVVGGTYNPDGGADGYQVPFDNSASRTPSKFTQTGLPTGLTIHPTTGVIFGKPTVSKATAYNVSITASNANAKHPVSTTILVNPLPTHATGTFIGLLPRNDALTGGLGGRVDFTISAAGTYSATVTLGGSVYSKILGGVNATLGSEVVTSTTTVKRSGLTPLTLGFTIDGATGRLTAGSLGGADGSLTFTGFKNRGAATGYQGYYTLHLSPPASPLNGQQIPQGIGYASFKTLADGKITVTGRLADTTAFTSAGHISDTGDVVVFKSLYTNTGSIHGPIQINPGVLGANADSTLAATSLSWSRSPQSSPKVRSYRSGFDSFPLAVTGARYIAPPLIGPVVMNLANATDNARLIFTPGEAQMPAPLPDLLTRVLTTGKTTKSPTTPNPRATSLTVTPGTGAFTGTFKLSDINPINPIVQAARSPVPNAYYGVIVTHPVTGNIGLGHVALPDLPSDEFKIGSTTPVHSAAVRLAAP